MHPKKLYDGKNHRCKNTGLELKKNVFYNNKLKRFCHRYGLSVLRSLVADLNFRAKKKLDPDLNPHMRLSSLLPLTFCFAYVYLRNSVHSFALLFCCRYLINYEFLFQRAYSFPCVRYVYRP